MGLFFRRRTKIYIIRLISRSRPKMESIFPSLAFFVVATLTEGVLILGNVVICFDSLYTTSRVGINFYFSANPISKIFFGINCLFGVRYECTSLVKSFAVIFVTGRLGSLDARRFNSKYILLIGSVNNMPIKQLL